MKKVLKNHWLLDIKLLKENYKITKVVNSFQSYYVRELRDIINCRNILVTLNRLGIDVQIELVDSSQYWERIKNEFDMAPYSRDLSLSPEMNNTYIGL